MSQSSDGWDRVPKGALGIGCKGCVRTTSVWCATCPVRCRWERKHNLDSLRDCRMGVDLLPKAVLR